MSVCIPKSVTSSTSCVEACDTREDLTVGIDADVLSCRRSHIFAKRATRALLERESIASSLKTNDHHGVAIALDNAYQRGVTSA
jgi:hypothetical protein